VWTSSPSRSGLLGALLIATQIGPSTLAADWRGQEANQAVPRIVEDAAKQGTLKQFANELAAAGVPVGIIIGAESRELRRGWQRTAEGGATESISLNDAVQAFRARHGRYALARVGSVVRIEPFEEHPCATAAERRVGPFAASGSALDVAYWAFGHSTGKFGRDEPRPGIVSSGSVSVVAYRALVSVDLPGGSLADMLDAIVAQAPGLGWAIQELRDPPPSWANPPPKMLCQVLLFSGDSWSQGGWYIDPARSQSPER
jgi:hypothetical protein